MDEAESGVLGYTDTDIVFYQEVNMAKRRNPKKEKAQRNEAYARKFRKSKTTGNFSRNRRYNRPPRDNNDSETEGDSESKQADSNSQNSDSR